MPKADAKRAPKLRFPGFSNEWELKNLQKFADFQEGPGVMAVDFRASGTPLIRLSGLSGLEVTLDGCNYLDPEKINNKWGHFKLLNGDLLISSSASLGMVCEVKEKAEGSICYTGIIRFRPIKEISDKEFMKQLLVSDDFIKQTTSMSTGATMHHFGPTHLKMMAFAIPTVDEQKKIAGFLTAVDERIELMEKKLELSKKYKKGLMQKLFPQKGQTNPTLRFKKGDGSDFPDWQVKNVGDVTSLFSNRNKRLQDIPVYSVTNKKGFVLQTDHFNKVVAGDDLTSYKVICKDDFAYNPARINVGSIARFSFEEGIISSLYVCFRCKEDVTPSFMECFLKLESTRYYFGVFGEGGVRIYLWYPLFSMIRFYLPSKEEQNKISSLINAIDKKIEKHERKLEQAKQFKKALLQQMFV